MSIGKTGGSGEYCVMLKYQNDSCGILFDLLGNVVSKGNACYSYNVLLFEYENT